MSITADLRPRRSALFVPADNPRALEKAKTLSADVLIFDLEDAVAPEAKPAARGQACAALADAQYGRRELVIRINALNTPWHHDDLCALASVQPAAIVVPKVNHAGDVLTIEQELDATGLSPQIKIWAVLETADAVLNAREIAHSSSRLTVLVMGTNDLLCQLHAENLPGRQPLLFALSHCLLAARSAGKMILDGVYNEPANLEGFTAECVQARLLGFDGKTLIHPAQVEVCNRVFTPTAAEIERARKIIAAFDHAQRQGKGVTTVDGRLIEALHAESARRILAIAQSPAPCE
ncbi:MAG TPA: CoA ester lyase [Pirellulales bacterium]|nr:CoA ester lyase [Pirellulales bacterium]